MAVGSYGNHKELERKIERLDDELDEKRHALKKCSELEEYFGTTSEYVSSDISDGMLKRIELVKTSIKREIDECELARAKTLVAITPDEE